jgi:hypothetical protein
MARENVETLRLAWMPSIEGAWLALCDPEVENVPPRDWPQSESIRGHGAVWGFYVEAFKAWDEGALRHSSPSKWEATRSLHTCAARCREGKWRGSRVELLAGRYVPPRTGRVDRMVRRASEALAAAGLSE